MPRELLAAAMAAVALYALCARPRRAVTVLIAVALLTPGNLQFPGAPSAYLTLHRLVLLAVLVNLFLRWQRRAIPSAAFLPTPVHLALIGYLALAFLLGVVMGDRGLPASAPLFLWVFIVDQLVTFVVVLAVSRATDDPGRIVVAAGVVATLGALVAAAEHFTKQSTAAWFFAGVPEQAAAPGAGRLAFRGGEVRVRGAVDYALAYSWVAAMALPIVGAITARSRRLVWLLAPGAVALSLLWTHARSAYVGALGAVAVFVVGSRFDRGVVRLALAGTAAGLLMAFTTGAVDRTFNAPDVRGSTAVRTTRAPAVLELAARDPFTGAGLGALASGGDRSTDSTYLQLYVELGVLGVTALALLLLVTLRSVLPGLRAPPGRERVLAAGVVAALVTGIASPSFLDSFSVSAFYRLFWTLAAVGVALAERAVRSAPYRLRIRPSRLLPAPVGALGGLLLWLAVPASAAATYRFDSIPIGSQARGLDRPDFIGRVYVNTACTAMEEQARGLGDTRVSCFDLRTGAGYAQVRIEAPIAVADRRVRAVLAAGRRSIRGFRPELLDRAGEIKPSWARTAPAWGVSAGLAVGLFLPSAPLLRGRRARFSTRAASLARSSTAPG